MIQLIKQMTALLPEHWQIEMRRWHYARNIRRGQFRPDEPEDEVIESVIRPGDWVVDIGANIGHYSKRFSELVGPSGRVIAIEPVPVTFSLLAANTAHFSFANLTLLNIAASDAKGEAGFKIPTLASGLPNYYMASVVAKDFAFRVMAMPIDELSLDHRISVVKVDVEGHEEQALKGMARLIARDHPMLIVETRSESVIQLLNGFGYKVERIGNSPNVICRFSVLGRDRPT